jgi:D-3-phosphoglycerate dehydrogenase
MPAKVLVTARQVVRLAAPRQAELDAAGIELVLANYPHPNLDEQALLDQLPGKVAAIAMPDLYTERVIAACAPMLKLIARSGVGYDSIDLDAATRHGVWVTTTPGSNHDAVADYTMGLILCLLRNLVGIVNQTRAGVWKRMIGIELRDCTLGIIGTGRVGREVAQRAHAFGMPILAYGLYPDAAWAAAAGVSYVGLDDLLAQSDVITLHAPMTPETQHLIRQETLAKTKQGVWLVNTARGELVDEAALAGALDSGHVAGAALDVFAHEPPIDRRLADHPLVIPLSHSAGGTTSAHRRAAMMAIDELLRVVNGQPPLHPVNRI